MSRIFIFAFVLFTTLFVVNAAPLEKRKTSFPLCPGFPPDTVGLDVKMTPDPFVPGQEVTFDIKGTMKSDIFIDDFFAGTAISTTVKYLAPGAEELPKSYAIIIAISHGNQPLVTTLACSVAIFGASELPAVPADLDFISA
ncbi:unnamed protein product [Rhizophagus irregularis]|uniref:MD-2-related lipid-recognition domain-containing protein n=1 Tax=Rhizophagus irregularis TaxID=588596 RepID=A0A915ZC48_9GLOM|nr:unnamed protein product [Rhizophagus irregularis]